MRHALSSLSELEAALGRGSRLLIASDFDGTLCPIAGSPFGLTIPPAMLAVLNQINNAGRASLAVISGRALDDLAARVPIPAVLAGNHGLEIRGPGMEFEHPEASRLAPRLAEASAALAGEVSRWPGAWVEDKRLTVTVHYRQAAGRDQAPILLAVRRQMGRYGLTFGLRAGKKAIEIYPRVGWKKGTAMQWIRERLQLEGQPCLCIGDDQTDESMFTTNADGLNIVVGYDGRSAARYYVTDHLELVAVLAHLAGILRAPAAEPAPREAARSVAS